MQKSTRRPVLATFGKAAFLGLLLLSACQTQPYASNRAAVWNSTPAPGIAPKPVWQPLFAQATARNADGIFGVKTVVIMPPALLLFYAVQPSQHGTPQITATAPDTSVADVRVLGTLGDVDVGVIWLNWTDKPGQVLSLQARPAGGSPRHWEVAPLKQLTSAAELQSSVDTVYVPAAPSSVSIQPDRADDNQLYVKLSAQGPSSATVQPRFIRIAGQGKVVAISAVEYRAAMAPHPFTAQPVVEEPTSRIVHAPPTDPQLIRAPTAQPYPGPPQAPHTPPTAAPYPAP